MRAPEASGAAPFAASPATVSATIVDRHGHVYHFTAEGAKVDAALHADGVCRLTLHCPAGARWGPVDADAEAPAEAAAPAQSALF